MNIETGKFVDVVDKSQTLKQQCLKRAKDYAALSRITATVDKLNLNKAEKDKINEVSDPQEGTVSYTIGVEKFGFYIRINVDSKGTIRVLGQEFRGSSKIKREDWTKNPALVDKALTKAHKHPYTPWPGPYGLDILKYL